MKNFLKDLWDFISLILGTACTLVLGGLVGFAVFMFTLYFGAGWTVATCAGCAVGGVLAVQLFKLASENIKEKIPGFAHVATMAIVPLIFGGCVLCVSGTVLVMLFAFTTVSVETMWSIVVPAAWTIAAVSTVECGIQVALLTWGDN